MHTPSVVLSLAFIGSTWLSLVLAGCGGPQPRPTEATSGGVPSRLSASMGDRQLDKLHLQVAQLQMASQDALDAAKAVGTPDQDLTAARREYAAAEQMLHEAQAAYQGQQVALSRDRLQAADATFRRAEEAAVGAGLRQLEQELAKDYGRPASQDSRAGRRVGGTVRANQGSITLLDGAGTRSQVIGTAQPGDTLTILAESGEWYRVRTGTGLVGWVSKRLVTQVQRP